jgi:hypothetical protein
MPKKLRQELGGQKTISACDLKSGLKITAIDIFIAGPCTPA